MADLASLVGVLTTLSRVYDAVTGRADGSTVSDALGTLKLDQASVQLATSGGNMVNILGALVVEPTIFVTKTANNRNDINVLVENAVDSYASLYVQTFKLLSNVYNLPTSQTLNILANKGFEYESYSEGIDLSLCDLESFSRLPNLNKPIKDDFEALNMESSKKVKIEKEEDILSTRTVIRQLDINITSDLKYTKDMNPDGTESEDYSTSVTANIPIIIKANVHVVDLDTISSSVEHRASNAGFFKRVLQWQVGIISFRDLILAGDLIDSYKKGALEEGSFAKELSKASTNNININGLLDKKIGLNKMIFSYIMTDDELDMLSKRMGYSINKASSKTEMMNALLALNITSINEDRELASIYINGISGVSSTPIKKMSKGGKDTDNIELLASALMTNKPIF